VVRSWRACPSWTRFIKEAEERVAEIREKLKVAQCRQKSYSDKKRREVSFNPGDFVYLKVSPIRGTQRFQVHGKLAPRYIGPYRVQKKIGAIAYHLELPERMADIHPVFHVSQLRRCLRVHEKERVSEEEIALQTDLWYQEVPVKILDTVTKRTRNSEVWICRVQWSKHGVGEAGEREKEGGRATSPPRGTPGGLARRRGVVERRRVSARAWQWWRRSGCSKARV
jgi:hypothetical protein